MASTKTDVEQVNDFIRYEVPTNPHPLQAVAREIVRLRAREQDLLGSNNEYLERARAAERSLREAETERLLLRHQLTTLREALEFYAEETLYLDKDEDDDVGLQRKDLPSIVYDAGATAEQALQYVFGDVRDAARTSICGEICHPAVPACTLPPGHDGPHGWDR